MALSSLSIMATDSTGSYPIIGSVIHNLGIVTSCSPSNSQCHPGPRLRGLSDYGNAGSLATWSCTFAAVANWERVFLGSRPSPKEIAQEFSSTGAASTGLSNEQVFNFWSVNGIGGVRLKSRSELPRDPATLQLSLKDPGIKALIAQMKFAKGQNFAGLKIPQAEHHWLLVTGYTPTGPVVVSWGMTLQVTWQQWNVESETMWSITPA